MYDRRQILLGLAFALGGASAVGGCEGDSGDAILQAVRPNGQLAFYSRRDFQLLGVISDAIIPRTETPGALDVQTPAYMDAMMSAWASDETKRSHRDALKAIRAELGSKFMRLPDEERRAAVAALDARAFAEQGELSGQYRALKSLIASVYYASEPGATQELQYELVPGRWDGDAPLSEIGRTWYE